MAEISTFELLVKRIAPLITGNPGGVNAAFRRVVQGYFLTVANPNNRKVLMRMRTHIPLNSGIFPQINRELVPGTQLTRNHVYAYDITGGTNNGQIRYEDLFYVRTACNTENLLSTATLSLPACQTSLVLLVPDIGSPVINLTDPKLEIRGYIEFVQVVDLQFVEVAPGIYKVIFVRPDPINLIFTPEIRGTFLDDNYPGGTNLDFDQTAYSLPTTTGAASITVEKVINPYFVMLDDDDDFELKAFADYTGKLILEKESLQKIEKQLQLENEFSDPGTNRLKSLREEIERDINEAFQEQQKA